MIKKEVWITMNGEWIEGIYDDPEVALEASSANTLLRVVLEYEEGQDDWCQPSQDIPHSIIKKVKAKICKLDHNFVTNGSLYITPEDSTKLVKVYREYDSGDIIIKYDGRRCLVSEGNES